jgi:ribonucrease Y
VLETVIAVLALVLGIAIGVGIGMYIYRTNAQLRIRQSETEARVHLETARAEQKEIILQAKDDALRLRDEAEAELRLARQGFGSQDRGA